MPRAPLRVVSMIVIVTLGWSIARAEIREDKNTIIPKLGSYTLKNSNQTTSVWGPPGGGFLCFFGPCNFIVDTEVDIESSSRSTYGIEYERKARYFSYGADYLHIKHSFVARSRSSPNPAAGEIEANMIFATLKKYVELTDALRLFIAGGTGFAEVSLTGSISGEASGAVAQIATGLQYRLGRRFGIHAEYRHIYAKHLDPGGGNSQRQGYLRGELDLTGRGYFAGLSVHF